MKIAIIAGLTLSYLINQVDGSLTLTSIYDNAACKGSPMYLHVVDSNVLVNHADKGKCKKQKVIESYADLNLKIEHAEVKMKGFDESEAYLYPVDKCHMGILQSSKAEMASWFKVECSKGRTVVTNYKDVDCTVGGKVVTYDMQQHVGIISLSCILVDKALVPPRKPKKSESPSTSEESEEKKESTTDEMGKEEMGKEETGQEGKSKVGKSKTPGNSAGSATSNSNILILLYLSLFVVVAAVI